MITFKYIPTIDSYDKTIQLANTDIKSLSQFYDSFILSFQQS